MTQRGEPALAGRVALVTGGSSGIGQATCVSLAAAGAQIVAVGRNRLRLAETAELVAQVDGAAPARLLECEVARSDDMDRMREETLAAFGRIDVLVASAGTGQAGRGRLPLPLARLPVEEWDRVIGTNLCGVFHSNRAVLPTMVEQGFGEVLNVCSARGGLKGQAYAAAYCSSKFGVLAFSEAVAVEVAPHGVRVQVVLPEAVESRLVRESPVGVGRFGSLPPNRVGDFLVEMLTQPDDVSLDRPIVGPFRARGVAG